MWNFLIGRLGVKEAAVGEGGRKKGQKSSGRQYEEILPPLSPGVLREEHVARGERRLDDAHVREVQQGAEKGADDDQDELKGRACGGRGW